MFRTWQRIRLSRFGLHIQPIGYIIISIFERETTVIYSILGPFQYKNVVFQENRLRKAGAKPYLPFCSNESHYLPFLKVNIAWKGFVASRDYKVVRVECCLFS